MATKVYQTPNEWYQCMDAGTAAVRRPYELRRFQHNGLPRLTIYHIPSFVDSTGWVIYQDRRSKLMSLQTVTWHQGKDCERIQKLMTGESVFESAEPTLSETYIELDSEWAEQQISQLMKISIPLHTERPIGLDGESFGVHMRGEFDIEWWCDGPDSWRELIDWTQGCIAQFNEINGEQGGAGQPATRSESK